MKKENEKIVLEELKERIRNLHEENVRLESENYRYNSTLNQILNSKSYKMIDKMRRIKDKFKFSKISPIERIDNYQNSYENYNCYNSKYQDNVDFSNYKTDIKTIAFYLPQYHTFKENDEWWGKGFMEWTNTKKSEPRFDGHYQPRTPHKDFGYYTLDNKETIMKQVRLAKEHGLYGFCFYYYWFSGKRLMEKPLDIFLKNKDIDFPFCLCWANENWTRAWDGLNKDVLISQKYSKSDYKKFIEDVKKYIDDKRYIKIDNKPVILVYNPKEIPDFEELVINWRKYAKEIGIGDIYIMSKCELADNSYKNSTFVDAEFDFPPHGIGHKETAITGLPSPKIFNYEKIVDDIEHLYREHYTLRPFYYTCTMGWDNSARRKDGYTIYYNYSLNAFYKWLRILINETRKRNDEENRFLFINAWNEWAEGTYLEPDEKYGYANINTLSKAIFDLELEENIKKNNNKN